MTFSQKTDCSHERHTGLGRHRGRRRPQRPDRRRPAGPRGPVHPGGGGPRDGRRMLRHRGDRARLPGLHHLLHREHAPARGDPGAGPGRARAADGALRAGPPGCAGRRGGAGRLERPGAHRGRDRPVLPGRRPLVPPGARRAAPAGGPAAAAVHGAAPGHPGHRPAPGKRGAAGRPAPARAARHRRGGADPDADRQPRPVHRRAVRVPPGQGAPAGQQPLRQARWPLPAGHPARAALPPAHRRRRPGAGVLRARHGRHGRDQRRDRRVRAGPRDADPHRGPGGPDPGGRRARPRGSRWPAGRS